MKCIECKFWRRQSNRFHPESGDCHRHAPRPTTEAIVVLGGVGRSDEDEATTEPAADGGIVLWPITYEDDFCGEFAPLTGRKGFV
jgi:hypothetical protein